MLNSNLGVLITADEIPLLNNATGTLIYLKFPNEIYIVTGYVDASANKWFANFPVIPSTMYPDQFAKLFATDESGNITEVVINSSRGMTVVATGCYWISGIVRGVA